MRPKLDIPVPLALLALLFLLQGLAAQSSIPKTWNRMADWDGQTNPSTDTLGNPVWEAHLSKGYSGWPMTWNAAWAGWIGAGSVRFSGGGVVNDRALVHYGRQDIWKCHFCVVPGVFFRNTTGVTFDVSLKGPMSIGWSAPGAVSYITPVRVLFEHYDASTAKTHVLFDKTYPKPTADNSKEGFGFSVDIPPLRLTPRSHIRWRVFAQAHSGAKDTWIILNDRNLQLTRHGAVAQAWPRYASPRNPLVLEPGSHAPGLGKTWKPRLRQAPAGAKATILAIGGPLSGVSLPFGTLLCSPLTLLPGTPGQDFAIAVPNTSNLVGLGFCAQAAAEGTPGLQLSNALDVVLGDR